MGSNNSSCNSPSRKAVEEVGKSTAERRFLKDYPLGFMTKCQFINFYKKAYMCKLEDDEIGNIFDVADIDKDGKLSFPEYRALCQILTSGSIQQKLSLTFKLYDSDRSHGISRAEVVQMLTSVYKSKGGKEPEVSKKAAQNADKILKSLDKNADGVLTETEFVGIASNDVLVAMIFGIETC